MEPIANVDRIVILLRQRLAEQAKAARAEPGRQVQRQGEKETSAVEALLSAETVDDRQLKRTLIQTVLSDQFGPATLNDPRFQLVVDRVVEALESSRETTQLLDRVVDDLRAAARTTQS